MNVLFYLIVMNSEK